MDLDVCTCVCIIHLHAVISCLCNYTITSNVLTVNVIWGSNSTGMYSNGKEGGCIHLSLCNTYDSHNDGLMTVDTLTSVCSSVPLVVTIT